jgi:hypothetical protein
VGGGLVVLRVVGVLFTEHALPRCLKLLEDGPGVTEEELVGVEVGDPFRGRVALDNRGGCEGCDSPTVFGPGPAGPDRPELRGLELGDGDGPQPGPLESVMASGGNTTACSRTRAISPSATDRPRLPAPWPAVAIAWADGNPATPAGPGPRTPRTPGHPPAGVAGRTPARMPRRSLA